MTISIMSLSVMTISTITLSIIYLILTLSINGARKNDICYKQSVILLNVVFSYCHAEPNYAEYHYAERRYYECRGAIEMTKTGN